MSLRTGGRYCFLPWMGVVITAVALLGSTLANAELLAARNLAVEARLAREEGIPLLILFSMPGCPACEEVRRSHLNALSAQPKGKRRVLVREIDMRAHTPLTDFHGSQTYHDVYARSVGISFVPVVQFLGADGEELSSPLVGRMLPDFYGAYLESALTQATDRSRIAQRNSAR